MDSKTLRLFYVVHKWTGLVAGFALFAAFYAGALIMFHAEIGRWQASAQAPAQIQTTADAQRLLDLVLQRHPEASQSRLTITLPDEQGPEAQAFFVSKAGFQHVTLAEMLAEAQEAPHSELAEFVNELHYALGIPLAGTYLMGIISLIYGVAIVSGVVVHLPRLTREFLALRPGKNLKRFWLDAHNLVGVVSLPFHVVFAWSGAALALGLTVLMAFNPIAFRGQLADKIPEVVGTVPGGQASRQLAQMMPMEAWVARASSAAAALDGGSGFSPRFLRIHHAGRANAMVEVRGKTPGEVGGSGAVALNAITGEVTRVEVANARDTNHATLTMFYSLHFGDFGGMGIKLLYVALGLAGAFLFYSGNLLFIEARRKTRQVEQTALTRAMARATVGVCLGFCTAVSATFVATQSLMWATQSEGWALSLSVSFWERAVCFVTWGLAICWATWRRTPIQAAMELLWATAIVSALIPVAHLLAGGGARGWEVDLGALLFAGGFGALAAGAARRGRAGGPHSVWAA